MGKLFQPKKYETIYYCKKCYQEKTKCKCKEVNQKCGTTKAKQNGNNTTKKENKK